MRDVATLVWVVLLLVGVISSMIASVRRRMNALPPRGAPAAPPSAPPVQTPQLRPPRPAAPAAPPASAPRTVPTHVTARRRLFPGPQGLAGAVIAAEVLGKPRALNDEYFHS
jgi:hypothetical protein